jgi:type I restriction enzyme S subunit
LGAGATPKRSNPEYYGGDINWYKSGELNDGVINFNSEERITELALQNSSVRLNKPGDILIAMYGATIGKTARLELNGTTNQAVCACTCYEGMNNRFLHLLLIALKKIFTRQGEGGAQPNISRVKIRNQIFALPPLPEQKAIVQIVNCLMEEVDQLEAQTQTRVQLRQDFITSSLHQLTSANRAVEWSKLQPHFSTFFDTPESVDQLKEAILQLAIQGKLTKQWREQHPDVEPASVLLERIREEKARLIKEKKIRKEKPLPEIAEEGVPFELPEGWVWCRLGDTGFTQTGSTPPKKNPDYYGNYIPFIGPANISNTSIDYPEYGLSEIGLEKGRLIPKGSLMMVCIGGSIGKCNVNKLDVSCNQQINTVSPIIVKSGVLKAICQSPYFQNSIKEASYGLATPIISKGKWEIICIPLPPLPEQKAIVSTVNQLMDFCEQLKSGISERESLLEDFLRSSIREVMEKN